MYLYSVPYVSLWHIHNTHLEGKLLKYYHLYQKNYITSFPVKKIYRNTTDFDRTMFFSCCITLQFHSSNIIITNVCISQKKWTSFYTWQSSMTADSCWPSSPVAVRPWINCCALPATTNTNPQLKHEKCTVISTCRNREWLWACHGLYLYWHWCW